jgi:hypothetical protein
MFDIPVVIFIFKRKKVLQILERIAEIQPQKLYVLADEGRTDEEKMEAHQCRELVENAITWDCDVVKNYATENRGVYANIGEGSKWVLTQEKWAIFLEDDNLPEVSFFEFCREMLIRYENDTRILWICGTNYLGRYEPMDDVDYVFTRHMLPCGWASWSKKFNRFYDGTMELCKSKTTMDRIETVYYNRRLFKQYRNWWQREFERIQMGKRPISWDYQMDLTIKANNLFGICPCCNQIKNIGVDGDSIHGGNSFTDVMTQRFCGMDSYPIQFPLKHPEVLLQDLEFEGQIAEILLLPFRARLKLSMSTFLRKAFNVPPDKSIKQHLLKK